MKRRYITVTTNEIRRVNVFGELEESIITQAQAADILGLSIRQIKRLVKRYRADGVNGLITNKLGKPSNNQLPNDLKDSVLAIITKYYSDFGPTLAHEKLRERHQLTLSVSSVRSLMVAEGLWNATRIKRKRVFQLRERRPMEGEMIQMDGSPHAWFEDRADKCSLLVCIDDATGKIMAGYFASSESIWGYFELLKMYLQKHGRPLSFYTDKHGIFRVNQPGALSGTGITEFGRAMKELDIRLIYANTPQAKGRVERVNRTLQDRLIKELRFHKISTMKEANEFLPTFIDDFNCRFAVVPRNPHNAHRELLPDHNLKEIFTQRETRWLSKNLTFQYQNTIYQIKTERESYALRNTKVMIYEYPDGTVKVFYKRKSLDFTAYKEQIKQGEIVDAKRVNEVIDQLRQAQPKDSEKLRYRPSRKHPWKRWVKHSRLNSSSTTNDNVNLNKCIC
jgi:hypothetical protein